MPHIRADLNSGKISYHICARVHAVTSIMSDSLQLFATLWTAVYHILAIFQF